jgi:hypothetical protein
MTKEKYYSILYKSLTEAANGPEDYIYTKWKKAEKKSISFDSFFTGVWGALGEMREQPAFKNNWKMINQHVLAVYNRVKKETAPPVAPQKELSAREHLILAHRRNKGRLTNEQIETIWQERGGKVENNKKPGLKYLQNLYGEIWQDIK